MCRLLSVHLESEKMLLATSATADEGSGGLLQWIRDGVRRFHELAL
jgi:hypothetical protein